MKKIPSYMILTVIGFVLIAIQNRNMMLIGVFMVLIAIIQYQQHAQTLRKEKEKLEAEKQSERGKQALAKQRAYQLEKMKLENFSKFIEFKEDFDIFNSNVNHLYEEYKGIDVSSKPLYSFPKENLTEFPTEGRQFEVWVGYLLEKVGFENIKVTQGSGDFGVDIVATNLGLKYVVQAKLYSQPVSNKAVQEVIAGKSFYKADRGIVVTNNTFTDSATKQAKSAGILLWNKDEVDKLLRKFG